MKQLLLGDIVEFLVGKKAGEDHPFLFWPPDVFAIVTYLLEESGAYAEVVNEWPPKGCKLQTWRESVELIGLAWRKSALNRRAPKEVRAWWKIVWRKKHVAVAEIRRDKELWQTLVQLTAAADEACAGVGIPDYGNDKDDFNYVISSLLTQTVDMPEVASSLCIFIHPSKAVVLPKMHTPQKGITIRSMSHHLALSSSADIRPKWYEVASRTQVKAKHAVTLLIIPLPLEVLPSQFIPAKVEHGNLPGMDPSFGFFEFLPKIDPKLITKVQKLYSKAVETVGHVDGIIFPEMALLPEQYRAFKKAFLSDVSFFVTGVYQKPTKIAPGRNYAQIFATFDKKYYFEARQEKHHRWFLEDNQIRQYGLGSTLNPNRKWWEFTAVGDRTIHFFSLDSWFTFTVLICEDLARPDPVGSVLRAVGPNLVIALLQDGPQLAARWSSRCATVLADDPGSSVLTVTSLGMSQMSRPNGAKPCRTIALWKDPETGIQEIELPDKDEAVVLSLTSKSAQEWTADGRHDGGHAGYLRLAGVHPLRVED